ncbi:MAG: archaellin/type IV pilin N-terminal domain-containing protein [Nitrosomonadaceae bacterium]
MAIREPNDRAASGIIGLILLV